MHGRSFNLVGILVFAADGYALGTVTELNAYISYNRPTHFDCREISSNLQAQQQQNLER